MSVANFLGKRERLKNLRAKRRQKTITEAPTPKQETPFEFMARMATFSSKTLVPHHLKRLADCFERMTRGEELRITISMPPRHGKSQSLIHFVVWWMLRNPTKTAIIVTHTAFYAKKLSRLTRDLATLKAGIKLRKDSNSLSEWTTTSGGGCIFTSVGGPITGQGADLLIIDDPHKDRAEAESATCRENVWDWYQGTAYTRVEPGGSVILCHTRWHPEDLIGTALSESDGWENITLPAIDEDGKPLWPERSPLALLEKIRDTVGRYTWDSQYQGRPVAKGGAIFGGTWMYDPSKLPEGLRIRIGIDLAYSAKTKSDYSALVVTGQSREGGTYIIHVARAQIEVPQFAALIKAQVAMYPGCTVHWHTSTTEQGIAQMLRSQGVNIMHQIAKNDKFIRAQPVAAAWNAGRVLIPGVLGQAKPAWLDAFVGEVCGFTGVGDKHDDMVDAMASAFDVGAAIGHPDMPRAFAHQFNTGVVGPHGAAALKPLKFRIFQEW